MLTTIDPAEVAKFEAMAAEWWDPNGKFKPLHLMNPCRLDYITAQIAAEYDRDLTEGNPFKGLRILDIGCGGGLLSEPMARLGATVVGADGIYLKVGPARVFVSEKSAIEAIKQGKIKAGDIMVLTGIGPMGTGMEETYQVTGALKYTPYGKQVALLTDARFSGVSTGACIGHIGPEGLAGGPIGKVLDGDVIRIQLDCRRMEGTVDLIGEQERPFTPEEGRAVLAGRQPRADMAPHALLPDDTRLWAVLQQAGGGTWGGCVYDADAVIAALAARK